jgi:HK97 family phage major capsid protein
MRSPKVIQEEIYSAELEHDRSRVAAKCIVDNAKRLSREITVAEKNDFDAAANAAKAWQGQLRNLRAELQESENRQETIKAMSQRHPSGTVYNQSNYVGDQQLVLPTNGIPAGDEQPGRIDVRVRPARLKAFADERTAYNCGMYIRDVVSMLSGRGPDHVAREHCRRVGMEITNAAYEGSGTAGGYLVPPQLAQTIIDVRERVGVARRVCQIQPVGGDTLSIPKRSGGLSVYYPNELQAITDSDKTWQLVTLAPEKRAVAAKISQELVDDSLISVVDNLVQEMSLRPRLPRRPRIVSG